MPAALRPLALHVRSPDAAAVRKALWSNMPAAAQQPAAKQKGQRALTVDASVSRLQQADEPLLPGVVGHMSSVQDGVETALNPHFSVHEVAGAGPFCGVHSQTHCRFSDLRWALLQACRQRRSWDSAWSRRTWCGPAGCRCRIAPSASRHGVPNRYAHGFAPPTS